MVKVLNNLNINLPFNRSEIIKKIKKVYIASDHAGYPLKLLIINDYLNKKSINFQDLGTNSEKSVDYPKFDKKIMQKDQ